MNAHDDDEMMYSIGWNFVKYLNSPQGFLIYHRFPKSVVSFEPLRCICMLFTALKIFFFLA